MDYTIATGSAADGAALADCMLRNVPALLDVDSKDWEITKRFVSDSGALLIDKFKEAYGDLIIPVDISSSSYSSMRSTMAISELLDKILQGECLYGKDWHFLLGESGHAAAGANRRGLFALPAAVHEDWLNWYADLRGEDDFRFLYIGGPHTRTGLHYDVLCSYSWSVNVVGRKLWKFWKPLAIDAAESAEPAEPAALVVLQEAGQLVFVPSGWCHTVANLGVGPSTHEQITLSINHNWVNGFNIYRVWRFLVRELNCVHDEMSSFRRPHAGCTDVTLMDELEWNQHCELTMKANSSLSMLGFFELICGRLLSVLSHSSLLDGVTLVVPQWGRVFCRDICDELMSDTTNDDTFASSSLVFINISPDEDGVITEEPSLSCAVVGRAEVVRFVGMGSTSTLSVPAFGTFETIRIMLECKQCPSIIDHLALNISSSHNSVDICVLFDEIITSGITYLTRCCPHEMK